MNIKLNIQRIYVYNTLLYTIDPFIYTYIVYFVAVFVAFHTNYFDICERVCVHKDTSDTVTIPHTEKNNTIQHYNK